MTSERLYPNCLLQTFKKLGIYPAFSFQSQFSLKLHFKMKVILILVSLFCFENCIVSALRFDIRNPITVDHPDGVIEIGKPTKFTCAYMTSRSAPIKAIRWYISYKNSNDNYGNVSIMYQWHTT